VVTPTLQYLQWLGVVRLQIGQLNRHMEYLRQLEQEGHTAPTRYGRMRFLWQLLRERVRALVTRSNSIPGVAHTDNGSTTMNEPQKQTIKA